MYDLSYRFIFWTGERDCVSSHGSCSNNYQGLTYKELEHAWEFTMGTVRILGRGERQIEGEITIGAENSKTTHNVKSMRYLNELSLPVDQSDQDKENRDKESANDENE